MLSTRLIAAIPVALATLGSGIALGASGGGIGAPQPPTVTDVVCQNQCAGLRKASPGARVQVNGRSLDYISTVQFAQKGGGKVSAPPEKVSSTSLEAVVPELATSGKVQVADGGGQTAESPNELTIVGADEVEAPPSGGGGIADVSASPAKGFFAGKQQATASFIAQGNSPQDVRVDVVDSEDGGVVRSLIAKDVAPQTPAQVRWNGKTESNEIAPNGAYDFEVKPLAGGDGAKAGFEQYDHIFPLTGKHDYGDGLGAGRGHDGQDVFASCGKRIIAARGGKVQVSEYHAAAGNYVVIDGKGTNVDYVYMHMQEPSKLKVGDKVKTGGNIGRVGDTGRATGCHLHFEMWDGDWYGGGSVMDPTPNLKRWDGWS
ncbi:MAG: peptidoglycan DD-metalloendopeptidase family protein [Solirubrobacterales bacterium]